MSLLLSISFFKTCHYVHNFTHDFSSTYSFLDASSTIQRVHLKRPFSSGSPRKIAFFCLSEQVLGLTIPEGLEAFGGQNNPRTRRGVPRGSPIWRVLGLILNLCTGINVCHLRQPINEHIPREPVTNLENWYEMVTKLDFRFPDTVSQHRRTRRAKWEGIALFPCGVLMVPVARTQSCQQGPWPQRGDSVMSSSHCANL